MSACTSCQAPLREGAVFCPRCGTPVAAVAPAPPAVSSCAACGAPLEAGAQFCELCGSPTPAAVAVPEPAVAPSVPVLPQPAPATRPEHNVAFQRRYRATPTGRAPAQAGSGLRAAEWLVVAGGITALLSSFLPWGYYRGPNLWAQLQYDGFLHPWQRSIDSLGYLADDAMTTLKYGPWGKVAILACVVLSILALIRGVTRGGPGPGLFIGVGIAAVVILGGFDLVVWAIDNAGQSGYYFPGPGFLLGAAGAVLVCVGGFRMRVEQRQAGGGTTLAARYGPAAMAASPASTYQAAAHPAAGGYVPLQSAPGVGVAGFVLALVGLFV